MGNHQHYAKLFKALSDSKRLKILEILANGEVCACDLLEDFMLLLKPPKMSARPELLLTETQVGTQGFLHILNIVSPVAKPRPTGNVLSRLFIILVLFSSLNLNFMREN